MGFKAQCLGTLKTMYPGSFAMVMATGIVSIASKRLGYELPAQALLWVNLGLFPFLWILLVCRLWLFHDSVRADILDHWKGAGFFTVPAACAVFGVQWLEFGGAPVVGHALWWLTLGCWFLVTLTFFCSMIVGENQVDIHYAINGAWLTSVVATQGLSVLASSLVTKQLIEPRLGSFVSVFFAGSGAMLYLVLITCIFYRLVVHPTRAVDFSAPYWVNMGAAMITSLALSKASVIADPEAQAPQTFLGLIVWSYGVWWIPILVSLGIWRHGIKRLPLSYDPRIWSLVFPLGMFTASTLALSQVWNWPGFLSVAKVAIWVAAFAWMTLSIGLVKACFHWLRPEI